MAKKPIYTQEFKERAVSLSQSSELTAGQVAKELGISSATLTKWRRQLGVSESRKVTAEALRQARDENGLDPIFRSPEMCYFPLCQDGVRQIRSRV